MAHTKSLEVLQDYLQDAIAAEKSFESQLSGFAKEGNDAEVQQMFAQHASETKQQYEALTRRLEELGGKTSIVKSALAHLFNMAPKTAQMGHTDEERTVQNLMMAFAVENAEVAMYEALAIAAREAGDEPTAALALRIQQQEQETADKIWQRIAPAARRTAQVLAGATVNR
jgi:ferritin-like metal-binding protein YciE